MHDHGSMNLYNIYIRIFTFWMDKSDIMPSCSLPYTTRRETYPLQNINKEKQKLKNYYYYYYFYEMIIIIVMVITIMMVILVVPVILNILLRP